jgi:hypothetical protein
MKPMHCQKTESVLVIFRFSSAGLAPALAPCRTTNGLQVASIDAIATGAKACADPGANKDFLPQGSPQPIEKAQNRHGNARKSRPVSFDFLGSHFVGIWLGLGWLGSGLENARRPDQNPTLQPNATSY